MGTSCALGALPHLTAVGPVMAPSISKAIAHSARSGDPYDSLLAHIHEPAPGAKK